MNAYAAIRAPGTLSGSTASVRISWRGQPKPVPLKNESKVDWRAMLTTCSEGANDGLIVRSQLRN